MSISGPGPFENGDAADWMSELADNPSIEVLSQALSEATGSTGITYLDIPECAAAVAAAEVVAGLFGTPEGGLPLDDEVIATLWRELLRTPRFEQQVLLDHAIAAVGFVLKEKDESELRQVWEDYDPRMVDWTAAMRCLNDRILTISSPRAGIS